MPQLQPKNMERTDIYKLLIGSVIPRPIAWVSSLNMNSTVNLAPFSAYNMVCSQPTTVAFSVGFMPGGQHKDTLANILREKEFVINSPSTEHVEAVALTAANFDRGVSELEMAELYTEESAVVRTPRVKGVLFSLECNLQQTLQVGLEEPGGATLVLGTVVNFNICDSVYHDGRIDFKAVDVLSRLGGYCYSSLGEVVEQKIPEIK